MNARDDEPSLKLLLTLTVILWTLAVATSGLALGLFGQPTHTLSIERNVR